jgi:F-type H+-transporting ATPase subunit delta
MIPDQEERKQAALAEAARHETVFDVGGQRVARVYAEALVNAADKAGNTDAILEEFQSLIKDVFPAAPQLDAVFESSVIGREEKEATIRKTLGNQASEMFLNFLLVLNSHDRLGILRSILRAAIELRDQRAGRIPVEVRSAVPLADDQRDGLLRQLRDTFHREPVLATRVDPDLLGGLIVQVGDWLYDASVRTQVETIRNQLIESSSHEIQSRRNRFSSANGN